MEGESGFTPSIINELNSSDIQGDQMEGESCVTGSIIDTSISVKVVLLEVRLMNFIPRRHKHIK